LPDGDHDEALGQLIIEARAERAEDLESFFAHVSSNLDAAVAIAEEATEERS
jgi:hypothetical protein